MRFLVLSFGALLVLGVTLAMAEPKPPMPIAEEFRACTQDSDCILIDMLCSDCCDYDSINVASKEPFMEAKENYCVGHDAIQCDCVAPEVQPVCKENRCFPFNPFADENGNISYE